MEARMRALLLDAGLAQPDEVVHDANHDELVLRWREDKLVVVVELSDRGPSCPSLACDHNGHTHGDKGAP
jgi:hypothetical protein